MHRGVSFLLASLLPLLVLSTKPLSLLPGDDIYYLLNEQQLAFLTPSRTALVTFPPTASVADVVRSSLIAKLAPNARGCEVTTVHDKIRSTVATTSVMASVLTSSPSCVSITCGQQSFMLTEVVDTHSKPYVPPQFETAEERNKYANEIKQQYDALQKERLSVERDWPYTLADIIGTNIISDLEWAIAFLSTHWGDLHPFPDYAGSKNDTGVYFLNDGSVLDHSGDLVGKDSSSEVRISIAADWGAGTMESQYVSNLMVAQFKPHYTLHLGDIYYVGSEDEMKSNVLGVAPVGAKNGVRFTEGTIGSFATPGNHEMYSRGFGFFDTWLPEMGMKDAAGKAKGQQASYFMFENEYWRIISLDTGYLTYSPLFENDDNKQPDAVIDWLKNVVNITNVNDKRGLIFVSHHQYRSAFGSQYLSTPKQLDELVPKGRKVLWLYGHEHRLSFYNCNSTGGLSLQAFTRCIGVGGFPVSLSAIPPYAREQGLEMFDDRQYTVIPGYWDTPVGFNGFTLMKFTKDVLRIEYRSLMIDEKTGVVSSTNSTLLVDEAWGVDKATGNVVHNGYPYVNSNMTFVTRE